MSATDFPIPNLRPICLFFVGRAALAGSAGGGGAVTDQELIDRIANGGRLGGEDALPPGYRGELIRLMAVFVDSELAGAAGFAPFINHAPGLRQRSVAARIVSEKFGHAERVLNLMTRFGVDPPLYVRSHAWEARLDRFLDLGNRRMGGDKRLNVFHYPVEGWLDAITLNFLMGTASAVQLGELMQCSYAPLAEVMAGIVPREQEHARLGETALRQLIDQHRPAVDAQLAVAYWFPRVAATFGRVDSDRFDLYRRYGLRQNPNAALLRQWRKDVADRLARLGLSAPPE
jgi:1,2-phenylacetyl-CoA epoxidase catalytic subunit